LITARDHVEKFTDDQITELVAQVAGYHRDRLG